MQLEAPSGKTLRCKPTSFGCCRNQVQNHMCASGEMWLGQQNHPDKQLISVHFCQLPKLCVTSHPYSSLPFKSSESPGHIWFDRFVSHFNQELQCSSCRPRHHAVKCAYVQHQLPSVHRTCSLHEVSLACCSRRCSV